MLSSVHKNIICSQMEGCEIMQAFINLKDWDKVGTVLRLGSASVETLKNTSTNDELSTSHTYQKTIRMISSKNYHWPCLEDGSDEGR